MIKIRATTTADWKCDRCGHEVWSSDMRPHGWHAVSVSSRDYASIRDICAACSQSFSLWMDAPKPPTAPPAEVLS